METKNFKVLIADDSKIAREIIKKTIVEKYKTVELIEFKTGEELVTFLQEEEDKVDLIITDINMPVTNGFDVIEYCRLQEEYKETLIAVISSREEDIKKALQLGANDYFQKPFETEKIQEKIKILFVEIILKNKKQLNKSEKSKLFHKKVHEFKTGFIRKNKNKNYNVEFIMKEYENFILKDFEFLMEFLNQD